MIDLLANIFLQYLQIPLLPIHLTIPICLTPLPELGEMLPDIQQLPIYYGGSCNVALEPVPGGIACSGGLVSEGVQVIWYHR